MSIKLLKGRKKDSVSVPTDAEMRLLQILWEISEGTVEDIVNAHPKNQRPNYKTTQTFLRIMEEKGFITHEKQGRVFVFRAEITRQTVDKLLVKTLISRNFRGSSADLLINLIEASPFKKTELDQLENYIKEYRKKLGGGSRE